jgi:hypothetical protein
MAEKVLMSRKICCVRVIPATNTACASAAATSSGHSKHTLCTYTLHGSHTDTVDVGPAVGRRRPQAGLEPPPALQDSQSNSDFFAKRGSPA